MYITDIIRRSGRNLKQAKVRTLLTAMAIGVGAFTLTLTLAASSGLRKYTDTLVKTNFDPAELIVGRDKEIANTGAPGENPQEFDDTVTSLQQGGGGGSFQLKRVTSADVDELRAKPYAEEVRENYQINIRYVTRPDQKKYTGSIEVFSSVQKPEVRAGQLPATGDIPTGTVLLPEGYIDLLGFKSAEDAIGKTVQIVVAKPFGASSPEVLARSLQSGIDLQELLSQNKPEEKTYTYKVLAVTKKSSTSLSFGALPLRLGAGDARELYTYTTEGTQDFNKYLYVYVRVKNGMDQSKIDAAKQDLTDSGYYSIGSKELQKAITQFVDILTIMVGVFGLITIIASVFGIVNTQYISVLERTREIGLMKALGMSRKNVSRLFMFEATWIGLLGGSLGAVVGIGLGTALNPWITQKLDLGAGNQLLIFKPLDIVALLVALMLVATIAGLLPARRAAKLNPIDALRTE